MRNYFVSIEKYRDKFKRVREFVLTADDEAFMPESLPLRLTRTFRCVAEPLLSIFRLNRKFQYERHVLCIDTRVVAHRECVAGFGQAERHGRSASGTQRECEFP